MTTFSFALTSCSSSTTTSPKPASATPDSSSKIQPSKPSVPICEAVKSGDINGVQNLLTNSSNANSICPGVMADMPVLSAAARHGGAEIVQALIKAGADVNGANEAGFTALHNAAHEGHTAVARVLLQAGASVDAKTSDGDSPLHSAAIGGRTEVVALLLSAGASVHSQDRLKSTPLHDAVGIGCVQVVKALIQAGANVNAVEDLFGDTPLTKATQYCSSESSQQIIADLLDAGANPLIANRRRENAVMRASRCGNAQVYRMITERARLFLANYGQNF